MRMTDRYERAVMPFLLFILSIITLSAFGSITDTQLLPFSLEALMILTGVIVLIWATVIHRI